MQPTKKARPLHFLYVMMILALSSVQSLAQEQGKDPIQQYFFPPELVMRHQEEIHLTAAQRETIVSAVVDAQGKFTRQQLDLQGEMSSLVKLISSSGADEPSVLTQLDKVLDRERMIKRAQITLLMKVRSTLTDDQKNKLTQLREK